MTSLAPGVTVSGLLKTRPDAFGLDLELLAGSGGLDRHMTNPYVQKTARRLADRLERQMQLAGMDDIDESEIDDVPDSGEEA